MFTYLLTFTYLSNSAVIKEIQRDFSLNQTFISFLLG